MLFFVAIKDLYVKFQEVIGEFFGRIRKPRVAPILDDKNETFDNASDFQFSGNPFRSTKPLTTHAVANSLTPSRI